MHDEDWGVRCVVADRGYALSTLINDKAWQVRASVAMKGYKLDYMLEKENNRRVLNEIVDKMCQLKDFYWIPIEKIEPLDKKTLINYFKMISDEVDLNSEKNIEKFKDFAQAAMLMKFGITFETTNVIISICDKYNIKLW